MDAGSPAVRSAARDAVLQTLAGTERRRARRRYLDDPTGPRVPARARLALTNLERAEAGQRHLLAPLERLRDQPALRVEQRFHRRTGILPRNVRALRQRIGQLCLVHATLRV